MLNSFAVVSPELLTVDRRKNRAQVGRLLKCPWTERFKKLYKCFSDCTPTPCRGVLYILNFTRKTACPRSFDNRETTLMQFHEPI